MIIRNNRCFFLGVVVAVGLFSFFATPVFSGSQSSGLDDPVFNLDRSSRDATISATVDGCGDGNIDVGEECDGANLDGEACATVGSFTGGTLACTASCTFNTSACTNNTGGGCVGDCTGPTVSDVAVSPSDTTAIITWTAIDNVAVASCQLQLFLSGDYTAISGVTNIDDDYRLTLTGLSEQTNYIYRIHCLDTTGNSSDYFNSNFTTTDAFVDNSGPNITNIAVAPAETLCAINWNATDESGVDACILKYSVDTLYNTDASVLEIDQDAYTATSTPLLPDTAYNIRITCTDTKGNASDETSSCTTLTNDVTPPPVVDFFASGGDQIVYLSWNYPATVSDFSYYYIRYDLESCPLSPIDGDGNLPRIKNISTTSTAHPGLINLQEYFYTIYVYDTSGNVSTGICTSATPHADTEVGMCEDGIDNDLDTSVDCADTDCVNDPVCSAPPGTEICTDEIDNDGDTLIDCVDVVDCAAHPYCATAPPIADEICDDGIDNDGDTLIDCADVIDCSSAPNCIGSSIERICNDGIDNDGDGPIDCADSDCSADPICRIDNPACDDGIDNDGDGLIDLLDPGCESPTDDSEYNSPDGTIETRYEHDISFYLAERTIEAVPVEAHVSALVDDQLTVMLVPDIESPPIDVIKLFLGRQSYTFTRQSTGRYIVDAIVPPVNTYDLSLEITYETTDVEVYVYTLHSLPYGLISSVDGPLGEVAVALYKKGEINPWNAIPYRQSNPQATGVNGTYGYVVPNGEYQVILTKDGFRTRESRFITVENNVFNTSFELLPLPETTAERIGYITAIVNETLRDAIADVRETFDDPVVEQVAEKVIAPTVIGLSTAVILPSLGTIAFPLLRFLFLQPILLFARKRREKYGLVYNSITKQPIDLVVVRLIDTKTNKLVQSRVTNKKGQFVFVPEVGSYRIEITKQGFVFPSQLLAGVKTDGQIVDVYHGEEIFVSEDGAMVAPNIPIDQEVRDAFVWKLYVRKYIPLMQHVVALSGIIITLVTVLISPVWYLWLYLSIHVLLYVLFLLYIRPKKPQGWGMVYNASTRKPVGRVVARLFSKQYNKLVATEITDARGRYAFLAGPNDYYVMFEKEGFKDTQEEIKVEEDEVVSKNVPLEPSV